MNTVCDSIHIGIVYILVLTQTWPVYISACQFEKFIIWQTDTYNGRVYILVLTYILFVTLWFLVHKNIDYYDTTTTKEWSSNEVLSKLVLPCWTHQPSTGDTEISCLSYQQYLWHLIDLVTTIQLCVNICWFRSANLVALKFIFTYLRQESIDEVIGSSPCFKTIFCVAENQ
jgi:hypothetical protein